MVLPFGLFQTIQDLRLFLDLKGLGCIHLLDLGELSIVGSLLIDSKESDPGILCKPGITGLERIKNLKFKSDTRKAAQYYYIQNQNLKLDVEIIIKTLLNG